MTEKRFNVFDVDGTIFLEDHEEGSYHIGEIGNVDVNCLNDIAYRLNELHEEKKELQVQCNLLREQANEFHRGARENANRVGQLERENKELKIKNDLLSDELEQAKAVIHKKWDEYLKKKEII